MAVADPPDVNALQRDLNQALARVQSLTLALQQKTQRIRELEAGNTSADILRKYFRTVPSSLLEPIDKDIIEECLHTQKWGEAENKDKQGASQINFRTIALKWGVNERTISRRIHKRLQYCNLFQALYQDPKTGRWFAKVDQALYEQVARAYHAAMREAADHGTELADLGIITFREPVAQRGTCTHCQEPMEVRTMEKRDMVITWFRCPKCKRRHKQVVKDSGWQKPETEEMPAESPDESALTSCQAFEKQLPPP